MKALPELSRNPKVCFTFEITGDRFSKKPKHDLRKREREHDFNAGGIHGSSRKQIKLNRKSVLRLSNKVFVSAFLSATKNQTSVIVIMQSKCNPNTAQTQSARTLLWFENATKYQSTFVRYKNEPTCSNLTHGGHLKTPPQLSLIRHIRKWFFMGWVLRINVSQKHCKNMGNMREKLFLIFLCVRRKKLKQSTDYKLLKKLQIVTGAGSIKIHPSGNMWFQMRTIASKGKIFCDKLSFVRMFFDKLNRESLWTEVRVGFDCGISSIQNEMEKCYGN